MVLSPLANITRQREKVVGVSTRSAATSESSASFKRMFERELSSCDHSSSVGAFLKQGITSLMWCSWVGTKPHFVETANGINQDKGLLNQTWSK